MDVKTPAYIDAYHPVPRKHEDRNSCTPTRLAEDIIDIASNLRVYQISSICIRTRAKKHHTHCGHVGIVLGDLMLIAFSYVRPPCCRPNPALSYTLLARTPSVPALPLVVSAFTAPSPSSDRHYRTPVVIHASIRVRPSNICRNEFTRYPYQHFCASPISSIP